MDSKLDGDTLVYNGKRIEPDIRTFGEIHAVFAHSDAESRHLPNTPTYFMYRGVEKFRSIRFDITRIPSLDLCGEFNKTFGHSHPKSKSGAFYSEIYEVLQGEAHVVLQKVDQLGVRDAVLLSAKKGDRLLVPPGYGHVTINPGKRELMLANLVSDLFQSDYSMYTQRRGACFYEMLGGKLVKNKNYGTDFELRKADAMKFSSAFGCFAAFKNKSLLEAAANLPEIEFLEKPETFY